MENAAIFLLVAAFVGIRALMKKVSDSGNTTKPDPIPPPSPRGSVPLTEADRRYREIQEEIRRRIAQRSMSSPGTQTPPAPAPMRDYKPSPYVTPPIGRPLRSPEQPPPVKRAAPVVRPMTTTTPPAIAVVTPASVPALPTPTSSAELSEAAAYDLPETSEQVAAGPAPDDDLRAALASPSAAQRAFILKELFDRPLCLRPVWSGGHEDWN